MALMLEGPAHLRRGFKTDSKVLHLLRHSLAVVHFGQGSWEGRLSRPLTLFMRHARAAADIHIYRATKQDASMAMLLECAMRTSLMSLSGHAAAEGIS